MVLTSNAEAGAYNLGPAASGGVLGRPGVSFSIDGEDDGSVSIVRWRQAVDGRRRTAGEERGRVEIGADARKGITDGKLY